MANKPPTAIGGSKKKGKKKPNPQKMATNAYKRELKASRPKARKKVKSEAKMTRKPIGNMTRTQGIQSMKRTQTPISASEQKNIATGEKVRDAMVNATYPTIRDVQKSVGVKEKSTKLSKRYYLTD